MAIQAAVYGDLLNGISAEVGSGIITLCMGMAMVFVHPTTGK